MNGLCKECDAEVDVKRLPDGPDFCPECRSVDTIDFEYDREEIYPDIIASVSDKLLGLK